MRFSSGITPEDIEIFLMETDEQLQLLEDDLIRLEQDDSSDELLQEIFRAAHTLKGSSATLGHQKMAELTHAMENALDQLRKGNISVSAHLIDTFFEALDVLGAMKDDIKANSDSDIEIAGIVSAINEAIEDGLELNQQGSAAQSSTEAAASSDDSDSSEDAATEKDSDQADVDQKNATGFGDLQKVRDMLGQAAESDETDMFLIAVKIQADCAMPSVRAFQVVDYLASTGEILQSIPSLEDVEAGNVDFEFKALVRSEKNTDDLQQGVDLISDLETVAIMPFSSESDIDKVMSDMTAAGEQSSTGKDKAEGSSKIAANTTSKQDKTNKPAAKAGGEKIKQGNFRRKSKLSTTVRVDVGKMDKLMNLVAELVIDRARLSQISKDTEEAYERNEITEELDRTSLHVGRITAELQDEIMKIRMLPVDNVFRKFPRMMRDTAQKLGKEINFVIEGQDTELDRSVIEEISDPLIHLLRNAVGHGIEYPDERVEAGKARQGTVKLRAYHQENNIIIEVEDDGKGLNVESIKNKAIDKGLITEDAAARMNEREALNLIFLSGLSTAAKVDDVSGRGVGMDIVRTNIERLNGSISMETTPGVGTKFTVRLPLTLAIIRAQLVSVSGKTYAIPISSVEVNLREPESSIKMVKKKETFVYRGKVLPILRLHEVFGSAAPEETEDDRLLIVVVKTGSEEVGLVVDRLMGQQEIVIKNLGGVIGEIHGLSGVTILGDGRLALIIDVPSLVRSVSLKESIV